MAPRSAPPFRADHVGSLLRPPELLQARADFAAGRIAADALRAVEDDAIRDVVRMQEDVGLRSATDGEFRRASWHMDFIYQLGGDQQGAGRADGRSSTTRTATIEFTPAAMHVDGKLGVSRTIFGDDFAFLQRRGDDGDAEADDPVAEHGPLPRRPRVDRRDALPRPRRVLGRPDRRVRARRCAGSASSAARTSSSTTRASRTSTTRTSASTSRRSAAIPTGQHVEYIHHINEALAAAPGRDGADDAHVPRQLPLVVGRRGRLRLRRRGAVQRARGRRLLHGVGRRALGRLRAAPLRADRASRSCSAWSRRSAASSSRRTS